MASTANIKLSRVSDNLYRLNLTDNELPLCVHTEKRMIGPVKTLCDYCNIKQKQLEGIYRSDPRRLDSIEITTSGIRGGRARLVSIDGLNRRIDELATSRLISSTDRAKYYRLINHALKLLNIDIPAYQTETDELTELKKEVADMRRLLNRLLNRLHELHPEVLEEESVEMIDDSTVTDYMIRITVEEDHMTIDCIPADEYDRTDEDAIHYYGNIDQLNDLKTKLRLKGDITNIDGDVIIADDYNYLKATLVHKLQKISKVNRKADMDTASMISIE